MPTYNEAENLPLMLDTLLNLGISDLSVLVVDDNSPDGTGRIADEYAARFPGQIKVLHRTEKGGLGPAYIAGFKQAIVLGADYIMQMDADFSHQPQYVQPMIDKIAEGYDMVIASRYVKGGSVDEKWSFLRKLLSWFANRIYVHYLLNIPTFDSTGGFRIWRQETLTGLDLERVRSNGYVFQVELTYITWRLGFKVGEIPIHFPDRKRGISKMHPGIASEAALRVWQIMYYHRHLTPKMRRTEGYTGP